jgi:hypothetical protein
MLQSALKNSSQSSFIIEAASFVCGINLCKKVLKEVHASLHEENALDVTASVALKSANSTHKVQATPHAIHIARA